MYGTCIPRRKMYHIIDDSAETAARGRPDGEDRVRVRANTGTINASVDCKENKQSEKRVRSAVCGSTESCYSQGQGQCVKRLNSD
jgi:hypothetical protein